MRELQGNGEGMSCNGNCDIAPDAGMREVPKSSLCQKLKAQNCVCTGQAFCFFVCSFFVSHFCQMPWKTCVSTLHNTMTMNAPTKACVSLLHFPCCFLKMLWTQPPPQFHRKVLVLAIHMKRCVLNRRLTFVLSFVL